jgi:RNA polymerase sigma-70 factor (ECF subfamily)
VNGPLRKLLLQYSTAAHAYLLGALRHLDGKRRQEVADDLGQDFAVRFIRGDFLKVDPERGRFRDFLKVVLSRMVADFYRRSPPQGQSLLTGGIEPAAPDQALEQDREFVKNWRERLLGGAWEALEQIQRQTGQLFYLVLRFRAEHPDLASAPMAEELSARLGKPVNAAWARQMLHRARDKFADLLIREVAHTLQNATPETVADELAEVGLLEHCREALARYRV